MITAAQKANQECNITGILCYRRGCFFQIIEGDDDVVDQLFLKIQSDSRHEQVNVILDISITQRFFSLWSMKLSGSVRKDVDFLKFISEYSDRLESLTSKQRTLFSHFYDLEKPRDDNSVGYDGTELMLLAWPNFSLLKQSPVIIELCAKLTKQSYPYKSLLGSGQFGTQQELDKILDSFKTLDILKVTESVDKNISSPTTPPKSESNSFYNKMKKFLRSR